MKDDIHKETLQKWHVSNVQLFSNRNERILKGGWGKSIKKVKSSINKRKLSTEACNLIYKPAFLPS